MKQESRFTRSTATYSFPPHTSLPSHIYTQICAHMLHRTKALSYILKYIHESSSSSLNALSAESASKVAIEMNMKRNSLNLFMKVSFAFRFLSLSDCHRNMTRIKGMFAIYWTLHYFSQLLFNLNEMRFYRWPSYSLSLNRLHFWMNYCLFLSLLPNLSYLIVNGYRIWLTEYMFCIKSTCICIGNILRFLWITFVNWTGHLFLIFSKIWRFFLIKIDPFN